MPLQLSLHSSSSSSSSSSSPLNLFSSNSCPETPQRHLHMGHRRPMCPLRPSLQPRPTHLHYQLHQFTHSFFHSLINSSLLVVEGFCLFGGVFNRFCRDKSIGFVIVGKGSNCLFDDKGFHGCVILNRIDFVQNTDDGLLGGCYRVGSGCPFNRFGIQSCIDGFSGLEFAGGIPGTVGGAVYMNAGADAHVLSFSRARAQWKSLIRTQLIWDSIYVVILETSDTVDGVEIITIDGENRVFDINDLAFGYRWSCFQEMEDLAAIVSVTFRLKAHLRRGRDNKIIWQGGGCCSRRGNGVRDRSLGILWAWEFRLES